MTPLALRLTVWCPTGTANLSEARHAERQEQGLPAVHSDHDITANQTRSLVVSAALPHCSKQVLGGDVQVPHYPEPTINPHISPCVSRS